ncbi:MAG: CheR family methyltransferase [Thiogranum sp.]
MSLPAIETLLKQKMGLHSSTVGSGTISQAVERRMRDCGITDIDDYRNIITQSETELNELIDTVVIPETWFYRDHNPFSAFSDWVRHTWLTGQQTTPLRILSVPCSTGEEPYTLAMCLADCGVAAGDAQIDAVDISSVNIGRALDACYGNNSFRGGDLRFRDRYFDAVDSRFQLRDNIRQRVNFEQANILDQGFSEGRTPYHVIFCRNLLIYFDRPTQHHAIDRLEQLLSRSGILFLGHSETSLLLERPFEALDFPRSFGFRRTQKTKCEESTVVPRATRKAPPARRPGKRVPSEPLPFNDGSDAGGSPPPGDAPAEQDHELLQRAFRLADQGHLDEAANHCETLLQRQALQADTHYLLGLIREAAGNTAEAERMFRKAVYLDPAHYEALAHLSVICRRQGDNGNAQRFHERATRAQRRSQGAGG